MRSLCLVVCVCACGSVDVGPARDAGSSERPANDVVEPLLTAYDIDPSPFRPPSGADIARLQADIAALAVPRSLGSQGHAASRAFCESRFAQLGLTVTRESYGSGVNYIGRRAGTTESHVEVVIGAHYDHIAGCPGADDNASGLAGMFEVARLLQGGTFKRSLVVACFDEGERNFAGSTAFVEKAIAERRSIAAAMILDMIGFRSTTDNSQTIPPSIERYYSHQTRTLRFYKQRADFVALAFDERSTRIAELFGTVARETDVRAALFPVSEDYYLAGVVPDLQRSDHQSFWLGGFPALIATDTGESRNPNRYCKQGIDSIETLDLAFASSIVNMTAGAVGGALRNANR